MKGISKRSIVVNLIGMVMARALFLSMNPIAVGFFSAAYMEKTTRLFLVCGTMIGMGLVLPMTEFIKYSLILFVIIIVTALIEGKQKKESGFKMNVPVMGGMAAVVTFCLGATNAMLYPNYQSVIFMAFLEGILVFTLVILFHAGIYYLLYEKKGQAINNEQIISLALMVAVAVYSMPRVQSLPISVMETSVYFFIIFMGYKYGIGAGTVTGAVCGIALVLRDGGSSYLDMIGIFSIMGILSGIFRESGKLISGMVYGIGGLLLLYVYHDYHLPIWNASALLSSFLFFFLLPNSVVYRTEFAMKIEDGEGFHKDNLRNAAKKKLTEFSESFQQLSSTFHSISDTKMSLTRQDFNTIFDELSANLCQNCDKCSLCWNENFYDTYKATFSLLHSAERNGYVAEKDVPSYFIGRCKSVEHFVAQTNKDIALAKLNLTWQNRMAESREAIAGQFLEVANIISDFSTDLYETEEIESTMEQKLIQKLRNKHILVNKVAIYEKRNKKKEIYMRMKTEKGRCITIKEAASMVSEEFGRRMRPSDSMKNLITKEYETVMFVEDTNFKILTGMARATKGNEKISGDNFSFLPLESGEMILTLSDGMGTGIRACEESESVVNLLEQFMETGFKEESAIRLINSILVLKSEEQSFSTIDMSIIDLFTGLCKFIKIGASTTFIKRDNWVETICSTTLPVGVFNQVDFDGIQKKLYDGDFIIMVTDGVLDCIANEDKENIMEDIVMGIDSRNPQEIADRILEKALEQNGFETVDDMTILVAGIWKK